MIELSGKKIWSGDFHTHWYWDKLNPTCYLAGMKYLDMDFVLLTDGRERADECDALATAMQSGFRFFRGKEIGYDFAHIVVFLADDTDEAELGIKDGNPSPEDAFRHLQEKVSMVLYAHPTRNWSGAYDGTSYQPLAELYKNGLIDGVQIMDWDEYRDICQAVGKEIPIAGGIDCHCCSSLNPMPSVLYNREHHPFSHITPCAESTTLVIADEFSKTALIDGVKNLRSVVFNYDTLEFVGPQEMVNFLKENKYIEAWQERVNNRNQFEITTENMVVGEAGRISVNGKGVKALSFPVTMAPDWQVATTDGTTIELPEVPSFNQREGDYYPLSVHLENGETESFALLVKEPVFNQVSWYSIVKEGKLEPVVECKIRNLSLTEKSVTLKCESELISSPQSVELSIPPLDEVIHRFSVGNVVPPGFEYDIEVETQCCGKTFVDNHRISFPACRKLAAGASPWQLHEQKIILNAEKQVMILQGKGMQGWTGPEDVSGEIALWWDKENFYFYGEVTDSVFYQEWEDWETFWGDSIQFCFDPALKRTRGYGTNYEFAMAKTRNGNELMIWYSPQTGGEQIRKLLTEALLEIEWDESVKKTFYRLTMPWYQLEPFSPKPEARFNFMCCINDNDGTVLNRKCCLYYGGNLAETKDLQKSHEVILLEN